MNKNEEYLKFYIDSNANIDLINKFIKREGITLNEYNDIVTNYLKELNKKNKLNKLYIEYCLKYGNKKINSNNNPSKRKETQTVINIINNYINEDNHNIKAYVNNSNYDYKAFIKFINNYKNIYLNPKEKEILKTFLKREITFNKDNLDKIKTLTEKIEADINNKNIFDILDYYLFIGWDKELLISFLENNSDTFTKTDIDKVKEYIKKNKIDSKVYKLNEFINYIKNNTNIDNKEIEKIINYMNNNKLPYNYYLFINIKNKKLVE